MSLPQALTEASNAMGESRDCSVKALAIVCDLSYKDAHKLLADHGRKPRKPTFDYITYAAIKSLGKSFKQVHFRAKTIGTLGNVLPTDKKYLIHTRGHIIACSGGKVRDWTEGRRHRIKAAYEII